MAYAYESLFKSTSIHKNLMLEFPETEEIIDNDSIYSEEFELHESICSESELKYGSVESNYCKITIANTLTSHKGQWFNLYIVLNNNSKTKYQIGQYKVIDDVATADTSKRQLTCYDAMYDIINADISDWYEEIYPVDDLGGYELAQLRKQFVEHFGLKEASHPKFANDDFLVERTINPENLSGADMLKAICELSGIFPNINRSGKMEYIQLPTRTEFKAIYPSNKLYPKDTLYPTDDTGGGKIVNIYNKAYKNCKYAEYKCGRVTRLQIRTDENDIGAVAVSKVKYSDDPVVPNSYVIEDNFLLYGSDNETLQTIAKALLNVISEVFPYTPFSLEMQGNPCIQLGQGIRTVTKYKVLESIILTRTLKGIQSLSDVFNADGVESNEENINGVNKSIIELKSRTNKLTRTVEETTSTLTQMISNVETTVTENYQSMIKQTAKNIQAWVDGTLTDKADPDKILSHQRTQLSIDLESLESTVRKDLYDKNSDGTYTSKVSKVKQTADGIYADVYKKVSIKDADGNYVLDENGNKTYEYKSKIDINAENIETRVSKGSVISSINQSAETIKIQASKIKFEGLVTANNNFKILTDGSVDIRNSAFSSSTRWNINTSEYEGYFEKDDKFYTEVKIENGNIKARNYTVSKVVNDKGETEDVESFNFDIGSIGFGTRLAGFDDPRANNIVKISGTIGYWLDAPRFYVTAESGLPLLGHSGDIVELWAVANGGKGAVGATLQFRNGLYVGYYNPGHSVDFA